MKVSYKKLWKLLIDKDYKKKDLEELTGISNYTIGDDITFTDFSDDELYCVKDENVLYDTNNQGVMLSYNEDLLHSYGTVS